MLRQGCIATATAAQQSQSKADRHAEHVVLGPEDLEEVKEVFNLFDTDQTGRLDAMELKVALRSLGIQVTRDESHELSVLYDCTGDLEVDWKSFQTIVVDNYASMDHSQMGKNAFELFATEGPR